MYDRRKADPEGYCIRPRGARSARGRCLQRGVRLMGKRSKLIALTAVGALALAVSVAVAQSGTTQSKITAKFSPNTGGKPSRISFDVKTFTTTGAVPAPGSTAVVHLPKGLKYSAKGFTRCNGNTLTPPSAANCPAKSKVGSGSSTVEAQLGTVHF